MAMETPCNQEPPERWARRADVQQLLADMLQFPVADHSEKIGHILFGSLRNGHVAGLFAVADSIDFKKIPWKAACAFSKAVAYHTWLFHFLGGAEQQLVPPPTCLGATEFSKGLREHAVPAFMCKKGSTTGRFWLELNQLVDASRQNRSTAAQEERLHDLRFSLVDLARLRLPADEKPTSKKAAGGGGEGGPAGTQQDINDTDGLLAFAMGTHERLGEGYSSREEPCAVRIVAGDFDILVKIAGYVRGVPLRRRLEPPTKEIFRLRQLNWRLERERYVWRTAALQLQSDHTETLQELKQAERRAAIFQQHAEAERRQAESQMENLGSIHQVPRSSR